MQQHGTIDELRRNGEMFLEGVVDRTPWEHYVEGVAEFKDELKKIVGVEGIIFIKLDQSSTDNHDEDRVSIRRKGQLQLLVAKKQMDKIISLSKKYGVIISGNNFYSVYGNSYFVPNEYGFDLEIIDFGNGHEDVQEQLSYHNLWEPLISSTHTKISQSLIKELESDYCIAQIIHLSFDLETSTLLHDVISALA